MSCWCWKLIAIQISNKHVILTWRLSSFWHQYVRVLSDGWPPLAFWCFYSYLSLATKVLKWQIPTLQELFILTDHGMGALIDSVLLNNMAALATSYTCSLVQPRYFVSDLFLQTLSPDHGSNINSYMHMYFGEESLDKTSHL